MPSKAINKNNVELVINDIEESSYNKVLSGASLVNALYSTFTELVEFNNEIDKMISCSTVFYWFFREEHIISRSLTNKVLLEGKSKYDFLKSKNIMLPFNFMPENFEEIQKVGFNFCIPSDINVDFSKVQYLQTLCKVGQETLESFMNSDSYLISYHCFEATNTINLLRDNIEKEFDRSKKLFLQIFSSSEDALITELIRAAIEAKQNKTDASIILDLLDYVSDQYKEAVTYFEEKYEASLNVDFNKLNMLLSRLKPSNNAVSSSGASSSEHIPPELRDNLDRILEFSNLDYEKVDFFKSQIGIFKKMKDKESFNLLPIESKSKFISIFFEIYEAVLRRVVKENVSDKALDMYLVYGLMDSSLLTDNQTLGLVKLLDTFENDGNIYSAKKWLTQIYEKKKSPSINGLGLDYEHALKEGRTKSSLGGHRVGKGYNDGENRVNFEIMNMFKTNHKLCYGSISTYFPILHSEMLPDDITRSVVTINRIKESIRNILQVDFTAFHREVFYTGDNPNLKKELIMKQVVPDIILMPTVGTRAIMWQETSGPSKLTPGRFTIPILTSENLDNLIIKLIGNFRWELCRTVMGIRWNDISCRSLTSDYSDYITEYKRNKNLSIEMREKIKLQIQKHHNKLKDIFTSDYEAWIKYESKGVRRVNKEARTILYKYCPLARSIRQEFVKQPAYSEIAEQFEFERRKTAKDLENRYSNYAKHGNIMEPELEENLRFYKEL